MSVKSTINLTRDEAVQKFVDLRLKDMERFMRAEAIVKTDAQLEEILELLNDHANGGEGYENYSIVK